MSLESCKSSYQALCAGLVVSSVSRREGIKPEFRSVQEDPQLADWNRQLEQDTELLKAEANRQQLRMVRPPFVA